MMRSMSYVLLIFVTGLILVGTSNTAFAQDDPTILLKIAKNAQEQIYSQIPIDSSEKIKKLSDEGTKNINALESSIRNNDKVTAQEHFLSSMKIFRELLIAFVCHVCDIPVKDDKNETGIYFSKQKLI